MRNIHIAVAALIVLVAGCDGVVEFGPTTSASDSLEFTDRIDTLRIDNPAGEVEIEGSDTDVTTIERTIRFTGDNEPDTSEEVSGGVLSLDIDCRTFSRCEVDYVIQVPRTASLELSLASASVSASGLTADVSIDAASGSIRLTDIKGNVDVNVASGSIRMTDIEGDLNLDGASGSIDGTGLSSGDVRVDSASGSVDLEFDSEVDRLVVDSASGSVTVRVPGGPYRVETDSSSGSIDVNIATDSAAGRSIDINTASGRITIDPA